MSRAATAEHDGGIRFSSENDVEHSGDEVGAAAGDVVTDGAEREPTGLLARLMALREV